MLRSTIMTFVLTALLTTAAQAQAPQPAKPTMRERLAALKAHATAKPIAATSKAAAPTVSPVAHGQTQQPRTAKSLACSKSADSSGLHGKPRKSFMEKCKRT